MKAEIHLDPSQLQPGYRLDRYELLCPLAYGGMASVWLARFGGRLGFERMVVIKMILPQYSQDPRFQEMFLDEARIASKIEHSNVARILDVGEHQENYFIVMEWVDGDSLSKVLRAAEQRKQRIPPGIALRIVADAAAGLHAAHELKERDGTHLGVVHRDVSPQNILIGNNGSTVIIDFGVAKARDRVSQETSAGQLKGKIRYMAPEQALGKNLDHRADVWALGAMLYEMFTGLPPFDGPNEVATLHKLTSGQRPPPMPRTMPEVLRAVVDRALAYDPEQRFTTALEMNLALEGAMVEINEPTTAAIVAHYTGQLLAERKAARKRAVDGALEAARRRDKGDKSASSVAIPIMPPSTGSLPVPPPSSAAAVAAPQRGTVPLYTETPGSLPSQPGSGSGPGSHPGGGSGSGSGNGSGNGLPSSPSSPSPVPSNGPMSLGESPSAASSATLGSAAMEYLPEIVPDENTRKKRYLAAAALGVLVAAGVVGVVLIISSAVLSKPEPTKGAANANTRTETTAPAANTGSAPPQATTDLDLPADPPTTTGTAATAAAAAAGTSPTGSASVASSSHGTSDRPPSSSPPVGGGNPGGHGRPPPPPPPPPPVKKPPVTPPPANTRPDRGF